MFVKSVSYINNKSNLENISQHIVKLVQIYVPV